VSTQSTVLKEKTMNDSNKGGDRRMVARKDTWRLHWTLCSTEPEMCGTPALQACEISAACVMAGGRMPTSAGMRGIDSIQVQFCLPNHHDAPIIT
jgi:hypothetical protein